MGSPQISILQNASSSRL
uniref:Uncharacterized protein n=1 Tax=Rhizophora mucronata TaxID=61149 RepID=A0A2P2PN73_RHIMU